MGVQHGLGGMQQGWVECDSSWQAVELRRKCTVDAAVSANPLLKPVASRRPPPPTGAGSAAGAAAQALHALCGRAFSEGVPKGVLQAAGLPRLGCSSCLALGCDADKKACRSA